MRDCDCLYFNVEIVKAHTCVCVFSVLHYFVSPCLCVSVLNAFPAFLASRADAEAMAQASKALRERKQAESVSYFKPNREPHLES